MTSNAALGKVDQNLARRQADRRRTERRVERRIAVHDHVSGAKQNAAGRPVITPVAERR
jgi:hypothetical protein